MLLMETIPAIVHEESLSNGGSPPKFPHTRAQIALIAREYRPNKDPEDSRVARQVVSLLEEENEDSLKSLLKSQFGIEDEALDQHVLDLMHRHRDDIAGVPFLFLTPTRRPISRPSSRASSHSYRLNRPDTPTSTPGSPALLGPIRRPHTPMGSPLAGGHATTATLSPASSPTLHYTHAPQFAMSLPASPLSSPRLLNAKASEFRPIPRPLSAASSNPSRADTPSPDLWSHRPSRLAIAAPLLPDHSYLPRPITPNSSLRASLVPTTDDEDEPELGPAPSSISNSISSEEYLMASNPNPYYHDTGFDMDSMDSTSVLTDGMTPFDVLSSVFGATLAPSELEEALATNGYDFERAMQWLVERSLPPQASAPLPRPGGNAVQIRAGPNAAITRGGKGPQRGAAARYVNGRPVQAVGNRVCRYFLAGECMRADCRFSHDLERALCRFWLRGTCAKQESCEFLHHLPAEVDMSGLTTTMNHVDITENYSDPMHDEFPTLNSDTRQQQHAPGFRSSAYYDPGRTRFSAAVKKNPATAPAGMLGSKAGVPLAKRDREALAAVGDSVHVRPTVVAPRPSPRLKLRSPSLLPTIVTGESLNQMYMAYRSRALQLGAARNACLSRAADAWRRGDGAAAKRFSREGHDLNMKMAAESNDAAARIVCERARQVEGAARSRDTNWSDDPGDRTSRGRSCGAGFGVCLGVARKDVYGAGGEGTKLSMEERMEAMLDVHGLHGHEATEVLEKFLLGLEREHYMGLGFVLVGEEKHTGTQDPTRGASRNRLATNVREWLHNWGYPWSERDGIICVDPLTHLQ